MPLESDMGLSASTSRAPEPEVVGAAAGAAACRRRLARIVTYKMVDKRINPIIAPTTIPVVTPVLDAEVGIAGATVVDGVGVATVGVVKG